MCQCFSKDINQKRLKFRSAEEMARQCSIRYDLSCYFQNCNLRGKNKKRKPTLTTWLKMLLKAMNSFLLLCLIFFLSTIWSRDSTEDASLKLKIS